MAQSRSHKSIRGVRVESKKAIHERSIDEDLPMIKHLSEEYSKLDTKTSELLQMWVPDGKSLEYYYGYWNSAYHIFTMSQVAKNDLAPTCMHVLTMVSYRIVKILEEAAKKIKAAEKPLEKTLV